MGPTGRIERTDPSKYRRFEAMPMQLDQANAQTNILGRQALAASATPRPTDDLFTSPFISTEDHLRRASELDASDSLAQRATDYLLTRQSLSLDCVDLYFQIVEKSPSFEIPVKLKNKIADKLMPESEFDPTERKLQLYLQFLKRACQHLRLEDQIEKEEATILFLMQNECTDYLKAYFSNTPSTRLAGVIRKIIQISSKATPPQKSLLSVPFEESVKVYLQSKPLTPQLLVALAALDRHFFLHNATNYQPLDLPQSLGAFWEIVFTGLNEISSDQEGLAALIHLVFSRITPLPGQLSRPFDSNTLVFFTASLEFYFNREKKELSAWMFDLVLAPNFRKLWPCFEPHLKDVSRSQTLFAFLYHVRKFHPEITFKIEWIYLRKVSTVVEMLALLERFSDNKTVGALLKRERSSKPLWSFLQSRGAAPQILNRRVSALLASPAAEPSTQLAHALALMNHVFETRRFPIEFRDGEHSVEFALQHLMDFLLAFHAEDPALVPPTNMLHWNMHEEYRPVILELLSVLKNCILAGVFTDNKRKELLRTVIQVSACYRCHAECALMLADLKEKGLPIHEEELQFVQLLLQLPSVRSDQRIPLLKAFSELLPQEAWDLHTREKMKELLLDSRSGNLYPFPSHLRGFIISFIEKHSLDLPEHLLLLKSDIPLTDMSWAPAPTSCKFLS